MMKEYSSDGFGDGGEDSGTKRMHKNFVFEQHTQQQHNAVVGS